jgi:hypothetical protein
MHTHQLAEARITIEHDGLTTEGRQQYTYTITTPQWEYVGNDIWSGVGDDVDEAGMLATLSGFLYACAESRSFARRERRGGENSDLFPEHVGEWAEQNSDELAMLSADPE